MLILSTREQRDGDGEESGMFPVLIEIVEAALHSYKIVP